MIKSVFGRVVVGVWLGCFTAAAAQLPPEIMVDRYLLRADRLMEAKDPKGALELMGKIVTLQQEHGLTLPEEFHFKHAKVAVSAGSVQDAIDVVNAYLLQAGREGKFYREALELLDDLEQLGQILTWIGTDKLCARQPKSTSCWKELTDQPGCYVWVDYLILNQTVTWTGVCSGGRAQGEGTLKWVWEDGEKTLESTGSLTKGKRHGEWVVRLADGAVHEGPYVEGKRHGQWVFRDAAGGVNKGPYVEGKMHGQWVRRGAGGSVWEGPYVEHKRHGHWVVRSADGTVEEGPIVEGEKRGHWVVRYADGTVHKGPYVEDKRHGQWVVRSADGHVLQGPYVEDKKHGQWVERSADGTVEEGPYVEGKRHGHWVVRFADGTVREVSFENGEQVGETSGSRRQSSQSGRAALGTGACQVPGYPNPPGGVANLGLSWCPSSVSM